MSEVCTNPVVFCPGTGVSTTVTIYVPAGVACTGWFGVNPPPHDEKNTITSITVPVMTYFERVLPHDRTVPTLRPSIKKAEKGSNSAYRKFPRRIAGFREPIAVPLVLMPIDTVCGCMSSGPKATVEGLESHEMPRLDAGWTPPLESVTVVHSNVT